jgi:predicted aspartyl protease
MASIRSHLKLTNAIDEALVSRGLLASINLRQCEVEGLVDTGAVTLVIPRDIVELLGLRIRGQRMAQYANGYEENIGVTEPIICECLGRETTVEALVMGDEVLIGQVVLEHRTYAKDK